MFDRYVMSAGITIDKYRNGSCTYDCQRSCDERVGWQQHFVTSSDSHGDQSQLQRVQSTRHANCVLNTYVPSKRSLEFTHRAAQYKIATFENGLNSIIQFR